MSLQVLEGRFKKKDKPNLFDMYFNAYIKKLEIATTDVSKIDAELKKQLIFYGVKTVAYKPVSKKYDIQKLYRWLEICTLMKTLISKLTPRELMQIFPITKDYDGYKLECKDYFYTMNECQRIGFDTPIGEKVDNLLWDYMNMHTRMFVVKEMSVMSDIRVLQGQKGIMEEWVDKQGVTTHTLIEKDGKQYLKNGDTGEIARVGKPKPRHLRSID